MEQERISNDVESVLGHDLRGPETEESINISEYVEDEWDNIQGDLTLFR